MVATNDAVYVGGGFLGAGTARRAATSPRSTPTTARCCPGTRTPTTPSGRWPISGDGSAVFAGGSFQNVGGQPAYGLAKIDASDRCRHAWTRRWHAVGPQRGHRRRHLPASRAERLSSTARPGTSAPAATSRASSRRRSAPATMRVGHRLPRRHATPASCSNGDRVHGRPRPLLRQHGRRLPAVRDLEVPARAGLERHADRRDPQRRPRLPELAWHRAGPGHGQLVPRHGDRAASPVSTRPAGPSTGNSDYVVFGGEFPRVNGVGQQGLVRFAKRPIAPGASEGPRFAATPLVPTLVPTSTTLAAGQLADRLRPGRPDADLQGHPQRRVDRPRHTIDANSQLVDAAARWASSTPG